VVGLLDDADRRAELGAASRRRAERELDWRPQAHAYVGVYDELLDFASAGPFPDGWPATDRRKSTAAAGTLVDRWGNRMVDLRDDRVLPAFATNRKVPTDQKVQHDQGSAFGVAGNTGGRPAIGR
jgi:hypothetical protein